jgi:retinol dehydrogenase-12
MICFEMLFIVLNILFVRELTKRLPANSPIIVIAANPGYCKSQLARNLPFATRLAMKMMAVVLGRTTEQGSRQLVWAAVGGAGREFELRGAYVNKADIQEESDYVLSDDGAVAQRRIWVRHTASWSSEPYLRVYLGRVG